MLLSVVVHYKKGFLFRNISIYIQSMRIRMLFSSGKKLKMKINELQNVEHKMDVAFVCLLIYLEESSCCQIT